jgi:hypothetical protein
MERFMKFSFTLILKDEKNLILTKLKNPAPFRAGATGFLAILNY